MKLVASMIVRNESHRYLEPCLAHLLEFCDEIRVLDDGSTDQWNQQAVWWDGMDESRVLTLWAEQTEFYRHEGNARHRLQQWTLEGQPTHVLAIDADEFVADGTELRRLVEARQDLPVWTLCMQEVWEADESSYRTREDGSWCSHEIPAVWKVPDGINAQWRVADRALACGRVPTPVHRYPAACPAIPLLHFGWTNVTERQTRYQRYVQHDSGKYHNNKHLQSIMNPPAAVQLQPRTWNPNLRQKPHILQQANQERTG